MAIIKRFGFPVLIAVITASADQALKGWITRTLIPNQSLDPLGWGWLQFTRVPNGGLIFQSYSVVPYGQTEFYIRYLPTAVFGVFLIGYGLLRYPDRKSIGGLERVGFSLFTACGLSNLLDHWRSYYVEDTIKIMLSPQKGYPFNLADMGLLCGLAFMLISFAIAWPNKSSQRVYA